MIKKILNIATLFFTVVQMSNAQTPYWTWANSVGGSGSDNGRSIATDTSGNVYVIGNFSSSTITFGSSTLINAGSSDIFVVKYDASGNVLWANSSGGSASEQGNSIFFDMNGFIYVTGSFLSKTITFGSTTLINVDTSGNTGDAFIVKYSGSGNVIWAKRAGGIGNDGGNSIKDDLNGNLYVIGDYTSPTIIFGSTTLTNVGSSDIFIVKYDASGNVIWAKRAGGTGLDSGSSVSIDKNGNVVITGIFYSPSIIFGSTTLISVCPYSQTIYKVFHSNFVGLNFPAKLSANFLKMFYKYCFS